MIAGRETKRKAVRALGVPTPPLPQRRKGVHHDQTGVLGAAPGAGEAPVKAARLAALLYIRSEGLLLDASKTEIAERWTFPLDAGSGHRYAQITWRENYERFRLALLRLPRQQPPDQAGACGLARRLPGQPSAVDRRARSARCASCTRRRRCSHDDWRPDRRPARHGESRDSHASRSGRSGLCAPSGCSASCRDRSGWQDASRMHPSASMRWGACFPETPVSACAGKATPRPISRSRMR